LADPQQQRLEEEASELRSRHEEWIRRVFAECCDHHKVNIHVLQEVVYQGSVLLFEGDKDSSSSNDNNNDKDRVLQWVKRVVLSTSGADNATEAMALVSKWDTEMVPVLLESSLSSKSKEEASSSSSRRRRLESVYANSIHQTRVLLGHLPSQWRSRAN